jgi:preprotein translocase subunit SecG
MGPFMQTVIIVIHLMIVLAMVGLVLLQRSEGGGLGMGGGGFMSNRGSANVLTRATAILAGLFFVTSLVLSILAGFARKPTTILNTTSAPVSQPGMVGTPPFSLPSGVPPDQPRTGDQPPAVPQVPRSQ